MQKKQTNAAGKAATGKTGNTGAEKTKTETRKPLTEEQRRRKNERDRARRAKIRKAIQTNNPCRGRCGDKCKDKNQNQKNDKDWKSVKAGPAFHDMCAKVGRILVEGVVDWLQSQDPAAHGALDTQAAEDGPEVAQDTLTLPDGTKVVVKAVTLDADKIDLMSDLCPIPWPIRRRLILARWARQISDIVDARYGKLQ